MDLEKIIDEAYTLYMPQIRSEITDLSQFLFNRWKDNPNVLEIGTKFGGTFFIWNRLIQEIAPKYGDPDLEYGMAISIDLDDGGIHGGVGNEVMDKRDLWFYERFKNCHFIRGDSHDDETFEKVHNLLGYKYFTPKSILFREEPKIDFLFIDGDHSYEGVKQDFEMYSPFVKPGGICCFHDITISDYHHSRNVYVGEFWNELKTTGKYQTLEFVDGSENWGGIGLICMDKPKDYFSKQLNTNAVKFFYLETYDQKEYQLKSIDKNDPLPENIQFIEYRGIFPVFKICQEK